MFIDLFFILRYSSNDHVIVIPDKLFNNEYIVRMSTYVSNIDEQERMKKNQINNVDIDIDHLRLDQL